MRAALAALVVALGVPAALPAQARAVSLLVIDDATDAPLSDVRVSVAGDPIERVTDPRGLVRFMAPGPGKVTIVLRRLGYEPAALSVDVLPGDSTRVTAVMTTVPQRLADVSVLDSVSSASPELAGFYRRMAARPGSASYITRADIASRKPVATSDLLRRITAIKVIDSAGVLVAVSRRSDKPVIGMGKVDDLAPCALRIAVDGHLREGGFAVNSIAPEEIHGIEVYPGPATIPAEFASMRRDASCGLIAVWTRRDKE
jgi:hypothetical protein